MRSAPIDRTARLNGSIGNLRYVVSQASTSELLDARGYYDSQRNRIVGVARMAAGELHEIITSVAAVGAFCALSPNNSEKINYVALHRVVKIRCGYLSADHKVPAYPLAREKALKMLHGANPEDLLKGRKTHSFYCNTLDPRQNHHKCLTVDGHVFGAWVNRRVNMKEVYFRQSDYDQIEREIMSVAEEQKELPTTIQALIWIVWRRLNRVQLEPQLTFDFARISGEGIYLHAS